ncbi:multidrug resistance regulator 1 [Staphylotrichum tortipilum]|uniref:Multidrug resistance regulator 1 n=1 Tax=Staphylotrichum tortipilum TaxID=2831512 RepID=A0AAN6RVQ8_9PEZI|nr:multidrug resistance regulator 1 [Staphylotrichum longicolle]
MTDVAVMTTVMTTAATTRTMTTTTQTTTTTDGGRPPPRKRQRVRLSCLECRRRKLSCDREFPCSRCLQSGTPERCEYETRPGLAPPNKLGLPPTALAGLDARLSLPSTGGESPYFRKDARESDRIRRLELEVAQLKSLLIKQVSLDGSTVQDRSPLNHPKSDAEPEPPEVEIPPFLQTQETSADREELRFFRGKEFKTRYFGPHSAFLAFQELTGLCPFMKETSEEWLRPLHIHRTKDRRKGAEDRERRFREPDLALESLLPSKEETDNLVNIYLDQFEQVHRIVHIPSFRRDYAKFWLPSEPRNAAFTAMVLAIMGISSCLSAHMSHKFEKMVSCSHANAMTWVGAVDEWQERQSQKHRRLIHYQIACLVYLAKRVNTMKKKRFWKASGSMTQDAIGVGLHREPSHMCDKISPFNQEMRRRIWATIQSYDLQASFDHGLPSILCSLHYDVNPPRNIDDDEFDEDTKELPPSRPATEYTFSSYQQISRHSLPLRLELSRVLTGPPEDLDYDRVIRYTNEINQAIDSLPSWDVSDSPSSSDQGVLKKPLLAYTLLHIQLRQYIIPLHQPFLRLRKANSKYQYSEIIYYNAARDMVLLNDRLAQQGIRTLNFLREDSLTLAINLSSVTMLQPRGSTNMIMINSQHTLQLLEKCLAMKEDRILRCGNNEPWGYSIMCAAFGLLEAHLGTKTPEAAKAASAERFVHLHYKLLAGQDPPGSQQSGAGPPSSSAFGGQGGGGCFSGGGAGGGEQNRAAVVGTPFNPGAYGAAGADGVADARSPPQSATPFPPSSSQQGVAQQVEVPGTPWWLPNSGEPAGLAQIQPLNPDFSLEALGLNLNELWGSGNFDWDAMMP